MPSFKLNFRATFILRALLLMTLATFVKHWAVAQLTVLPKSTSALLNENATFYCEGNGIGIFWKINQSYVRDQEMIQYHFSSNPDNQSSTLYIPALEDHHNISVQCVIVASTSQNHDSPEVYLYVLGIAAIPWLCLDSTYSYVEWDRPFASNVSVINYNFSFIGNNISLSGTTTALQFSLLTYHAPCQVYEITVTPFSVDPDYSGPSITITEEIKGGKFFWDGPCAIQVSFGQDGLARVTVTCKVKSSGPTCMGHSILAFFSSYTNSSGIGLQLRPWPIETVLRNDNSIELNEHQLPVSERLFFNISLMDVAGAEVDQIHQDFDTYGTKTVDVTMEESSAGVKFTVVAVFETTTTLWGCIVFFKSPLLEEFNVTVERLSSTSSLSSATSLIPSDKLTFETIYSLDAVIYDCAGFDCNVDYKKPALIRSPALVFSLTGPDDPTTCTMNATICSSDTSSTPVEKEAKIILLTGAVGVLSTLLIILVVVLGILIVVIICQHRKLKKTVSRSQLKVRLEATLLEGHDKRQDRYVDMDNLTTKDSKHVHTKIDQDNEHGKPSTDLSSHQENALAKPDDVSIPSKISVPNKTSVVNNISMVTDTSMVTNTSMLSETKVFLPQQSSETHV